MTLILAAVIPSAVIMWWFHRRDVNPEPRAVVWATFGYGVLSIVPTVLVVAMYDGIIGGVADPVWRGILEAFLGASLPEEFFKYVVVVGFAARHPEFDEPMDGIVYGVAASLGFATLENLLYVLEGGAGVAAIRAVTAVPGHALYGAVMGAYVGRAYAEPGRARRHLTLALAWPVLLHGIYDAPLLAMQAADGIGRPDAVDGAWLLLVPAVLLFSLRWVWRQVALLRARQLHILPEAETLVLMPRRRRDDAVHGERGVLGWIRLTAGWVLAGSAVLMTLGLTIAFATGGVDPIDRRSTLIGGAFLVGVPLLLGAALLKRELLEAPGGARS